MLTSDELKDFYSELGRRVHNARIDANVSQSTLAEALQLTRSSVANLEAGRQRIQAHSLAIIANVLSVEPQMLLPGSPVSVEPKYEFATETARKFVQSGLASIATGGDE